MQININKLKLNAKIPFYAHEGDAGMDVFSCEDYLLKKDEIHAYSTGISSEIPEGFAAVVHDKSGLALKSGIKTMGGVIDSGYRGEWKIILKNLGSFDFQINIGDKIAQVIIYSIERAKIIESKTLSETKRGAGGFGSTGK